MTHDDCMYVVWRDGGVTRVAKPIVVKTTVGGDLSLDDCHYLGFPWRSWTLQVDEPGFFDANDADGVARLLGGLTVPRPRRVIRNGPATVCLWDDGTKTVVKRHDGDPDDPYVGVLWCVAKRILGSARRFVRIVDEIGGEDWKK